MKKIGILLSLILLFINLSAQETENKNSKISTSWGYNVHLYKGMFDFQPPVIDTSSLFYPDSYYYYTSFKHRSDLNFNVEYKFNKLFSVSSGVELFFGLTKQSPNMQLINNLQLSESYSRKYMTTIYLNIPLYINFSLNKTVISAGIIHPISYVGIENTKTHNGLVTKKLFYSPLELLQDYNYSVSLNLTQKELFRVGNLNMGIKFGITISSYQYISSYYNLGFILY